MRQTYWASLALLLAVALTGCGGAAQKPVEGPVRTLPAPVEPAAPAAPPTGGGIAYQPAKFEVVPEGTAPAAVAKELAQMRTKAGTKALVVEGTTYAIITAGEKPSGGYSVSVLSIGDSEGKLQVVYKVESPAPGTMTTQALTYPAVVVKLQNPANLPIIFSEAK